MSTRPRPTSTIPKAPTDLSPDCVIDTHAQLIGLHTIAVGPDAIIHPRARVNSANCRITIGTGCIIHERSTIGFSDPLSVGGDQVPEISLGRNVVVGSAAIVAASSVGDSTVIGVGASIEQGAVIGKHCKVAPLCRVAREERVPDFTVILGDGPAARRMQKPGLEELGEQAHEKQLAALKKLIKSDLAKHAAPLPS